ncbi:MAG TPA: phosphoglycerate mutase family protein [Polyangiaceae bacterium]|nr:phosphoglycerate mutase family protein [Polyangiaceae bacterium]
MSILRSTLEHVAFVWGLMLVSVGCSESADTPPSAGEPSGAGQANTARGSTDKADTNTPSTSQSGSSAIGGSGGESANTERTNVGGAISETGESANPASDGGATNSSKSSTSRVEGGSGNGGIGAGRTSIGVGGRSNKTSGSGGAAPKTNSAGDGGTKASSDASGGDTSASSNKGLTLYYVRHAEVVGNTVEPDQVTLENSETLTELGQSQIAAVTKYLQSELDATPDAILVSPTKRTQKTIEPYLVETDRQGEIWMELAECCNQAPTGAALPTEPKYMSFFKAEIVAENLALKSPSANLYWQNDTYEQGLFMVMTAKAAILSRYGQSGKTIFVVGHASAGQIMIGLLRGDDMTQGAVTTGMNAVYLLNTGIMKLTQDPSTGLFKVVGQNMNKPQTS